MANLNLNKVILGGRLTADPELKTTPSGVSVTTIRIAVGRRFAKQGDLFSLVVKFTAVLQTLGTTAL